MKKRYLLPCIMLIICIMLTACTTPSQNISNNTPPATEQPATEQPTTAPDTEAPSPTPEPNAKLNGIDCERVLDFLETKDENGVKNGEKINPGYNPLDYNTWHYGTQGTEYFIGFIFTPDGRLSDVDLRGERTANGKLVGALNLEGCSELRVVEVIGQDIESVCITSDLHTLNICDCPELEAINTEFPNVRIKYCTVENCPKLDRFTWFVDGLLADDPGQEGKDYFTLDSEIGLQCEENGRFDLLIGHGTDENPDFSPYLLAVPDPGHEFLGWYDLDGNLLSGDMELRIFDGRKDDPLPNLFDLCGSFFMFVTARFSD